MKQPPPCPACGGSAVPILFGFPTDEAFEAAQQGEIALGGCVVSGDDPRWECSSCGTRWRDAGDARR